MAFAISSVVPPQFPNDSLRASTSSGAVLISASHGAIWFLPKMAEAAAICSCSDRFAKPSCSSFCICKELFIVPSSLNALQPPRYASIASDASFAGFASLAMPVFRLFAAVDASYPAFAMTPMYSAASSTPFPAAEKIGAAMDMAEDNPSTSSAELLHAAAKTSA